MSDLDPSTSDAPRPLRPWEVDDDATPVLLEASRDVPAAVAAPVEPAPASASLAVDLELPALERLGTRGGRKPSGPPKPSHHKKRAPVAGAIPKAPPRDYQKLHVDIDRATLKGLSAIAIARSVPGSLVSRPDVIRAALDGLVAAFNAAKES